MTNSAPSSTQPSMIVVFCAWCWGVSINMTYAATQSKHSVLHIQVSYAAMAYPFNGPPGAATAVGPWKGLQGTMGGGVCITCVARKPNTLCSLLHIGMLLWYTPFNGPTRAGLLTHALRALAGGGIAITVVGMGFGESSRPCAPEYMTCLKQGSVDPGAAMHVLRKVRYCPTAYATQSPLLSYRISTRSPVLFYRMCYATSGTTRAQRDRTTHVLCGVRD